MTQSGLVIWADKHIIDARTVLAFVCMLAAIFRPLCRLSQLKKYWEVMKELGGIIYKLWYQLPCITHIILLNQVAENFARLWNMPDNRILCRKQSVQGVSCSMHLLCLQIHYYIVFCARARAKAPKLLNVSYEVKEFDHFVSLVYRHRLWPNEHFFR